MISFSCKGKQQVQNQQAFIVVHYTHHNLILAHFILCYFRVSIKKEKEKNCLMLEN